ncbi:MAG: rhodanese-like domain-containing protein [Chitinophagaceae bacterium]|nr:rhodanese-like domain-containing protein [Chitinophagaceae bacterium]
MNILQRLFGSTPAVDLQELIDDKAFLVDVRTPGEFAQGHVKGSVNIPVDVIPAKLVQFKNKKHIVVFCRSGNRSGMAKSILEQHGFTNVVNGGTWEQVNKFVK